MVRTSFGCHFCFCFCWRCVLPFAVLISCVQDEKQEKPHGGKLIFRLKLKLISAECRTVYGFRRLSMSMLLPF